MGESEFDVAVLGGGGAGLSVVVALDRLARRRRAAGEDVTVPSLVLVDPVVRAGADRTWCFWDSSAAVCCGSKKSGSGSHAGGFKGRAREVPPVALARSLREAFGAGLRIAHEYGMTELSSQAYDRPRPDGAPGLYQTPPWMRLDVVDPVTLAPLEMGAVGLVRVLDLANLGSTVAVQTSDLGRMHPEGLELLGRAPGATPRGCARAMDALLDP